MEVYVIVGRENVDIQMPVIKKTKEEALDFLMNKYNNACEILNLYEGSAEHGIFLEESENNVAFSFINLKNNWWEYIVYRINM